MDASTSLKSLLLAIRQYRNNRSALNASQLQKHIEDVSGLKCGRVLFSGQVLPSECLSGLMEVAGDPNTSHALTGSIISLLAQFAASDGEAKEALHSSYNFTGTLASIIHCNRSTPEEPLVLQCLNVLQRLTYSVRTQHCASHIHELISFLMQHVQSSNDDIVKACLGLMANLCRHDISVQSHIKSQSNVKAFYRALINFLGHNCLTVVVFALSILSSLTLNEEVGQKLFNAKNIHQTFQLIFNITVNGDGTLTRKYAVDLLVDLLKNPKIADYLTKYKHLSVCLAEVLGLLHNKDPDTASKVMELLVSLCSVPVLRKLVCETVLRPPAPRLQPATRKGVQARGSEPSLALVHWVTSPLDGPEQCYMQALSLLAELFEEAIDSSLCSSAQSFVELLLQEVLVLLQSPDSTEGEQLLKKHCLRAGRVVDFLLVLCGNDALRLLVSQRLSPEVCVSQVELLLSYSQDLSGSTCTTSNYQLSQVCSKVILKTLELMSHLRQQMPDMETSFYRILQDQRMVTPLSLAMTSNCREHVQVALRILFEAAPLPDFPSVILGDSIAANNAYRQKDSELSIRSSPASEDVSFVGKSFPMMHAEPSGSACQSIDSLIEKLQNGVEEKVKDVHMSEIIDVYEQKLSALACKESRLQDLLEAKALVLSQADRLIAQYRCQRAQAEAEARKLASLLKDTERKKEDLQTELNDHLLEVERLKSDSQQLLEHNGRLQEVADQHQELKGTYNQLLTRYDKSEWMLKELRAAHISLTQQAEGLRKTNEGLKLQQERTLAEMAEKEQQIKVLKTDVLEKERTITGFQNDLRRQEEQIHEMEENIFVLRKELNKTEQARKDTSIKASSLELQKSQLEAKLEKMEEELSKHTQMIAMIHSLSSGKLKDVTANLSL
ncbi:protein CIP2A homolog isoform X3 [Sinocyclocheilus anshuiensis]|uniref:protein CIP2A homolog isoform X3 n=1 Tax=Sinocyclocheilus anshuiensis TaxID=1608454 RepID=UPI0007BA695E|nr:PREDICTED: protein CIP2A homolog isoform X3 [Sinocyclocheilus anshuiensis]